MPSSSRSSATLDDLRRRNLAVLLGLIHRFGPMTRSALAERMGVNRSTVGALVTELAEVDLVREGAGIGRGVGRPSLVVAPVPEAAGVVAYDLRVERVVAALVGLGGTVLATEQRRSRTASMSPAAAVRSMTDLARGLAQRLPEVPIVGAAVAVPGLARHGDGHVVLAPNLGWSDVPLAEMLSTSLRDLIAAESPVFVGNDADFGVLAEHTRGAAVSAANVVFLSGEVGIGGGIVLDGQVMAGGRGFGGEVGHMVVNPAGRSCRCGATGCWETQIGREAVLTAAGLGDVIGDVPDLVSLVESDPSRRAALEQVAEWLGLGLANLVNIFNPDVVILGGHLRSLHQAAPEAVERRLDQALPAARGVVELRYPVFGREAALMGAAEVAFGPLLNDPLTRISAAAAAS